MYSAEARSSSVSCACSAVAFSRASALRCLKVASSIWSAMYSSSADSASSRARLSTAAVCRARVESVDLRSEVRKADAVLPAFAREGQRGHTLKRVARRGRCRLLFRLGVPRHFSQLAQTRQSAFGRMLYANAFTKRTTAYTQIHMRLEAQSIQRGCGMGDGLKLGFNIRDPDAKT